MAKIHEFSASRGKKSRFTRGVAIAAMVGAAFAILTASVVSLGEYSTSALGIASATTQQRALTGAANATSVDAATRDFDYFPSHYRNQATEPAEPIATF